MAEASRRAARSARKGGLANAIFVVAAAESLPAELDGAATVVTLHFPWGSLLRGVAAAEPWLAAALVRVTRPGALVDAFVSVTPRDRIPGQATLDPDAMLELEAAWSDLGFTVESAAPATPQEIAAPTPPGPSAWAPAAPGPPGDSAYEPRPAAWRRSVDRRSAAGSGGD